MEGEVMRPKDITPELQNKLEHLVKDCALFSQEWRSYLPKTGSEAAAFKAHEWVMDVARAAYCAGYNDASEKIKKVLDY